MPPLTRLQEELAADAPFDFSDLRALFINCTLKRSPEVSNTQALGEIAIGVMERNGVQDPQSPAVAPDTAPGAWPDRTEHGWPGDECPALYERVQAADILVLLSPIWLG